MKTKIFIVLLILISIPAAAFAKSQAKAGLINARGKKVGEAVFSEPSPQRLQISLEIWDLPPGVHAMHIHDAGKCEPPQFKTAGGHFNPEGKKHGTQNPEGFHAGDLPNIAVAGNGKGKINVEMPGLSLSQGPHPILKQGGTSLVIHAGPDDERTDPAGNSGDRIACGVIQ